ncbi:MAG: sensor histidine kinase [Rhodobacteraceae bacterium]|nr:sensor histidine kinase [Paracoccaceae bacterium]
MTPNAIDGAQTETVASLRRLQTTTLSLLAGFVFLVLFAGIYHLGQQYRETVGMAESNARTTVRYVEAHASRVVTEAFRVMDGISDLVETQPQPSGIDEFTLHGILAERLSQLPNIAALFVVSPQKTMLASARVYPVTDLGPLPRTSPIWGRFDAATEVMPRHFIGQAYPAENVLPDGSSRIRDWYLPLLVRIEDINGRVMGWVVAPIKMSEFADYYNTIDVGRSGVVSLWQEDGMLIASSRGGSDPPGTMRAEIAEYFSTIPAVTEGADELAYALSDGYSRRIQASGKVGNLPLAVAVLLRSESYLAAWRDSRDRIGLAMVLIVISTIGGGLFIYRQLKRAQLNEQALRHAKVTAEEASEAKSRFLAHMSHEFRTPLNAIMGFSEIIKTKVLGEGVSPIYVSYADHIHKSGEHLLKIVNDILDMAKIESGAQPIAREPVDVSGAVESAVSFVEGLADQKRLHIRVLMPAQLPRINGNERLIRQIVINLLSNAIKFSPRSAEIEVSARHSDDGPLEIAIADRGPGIETSILRRIGEPFLQGNPSISRSGQGTGLGLSICKNYLNLMGGELVIDSTFGAGTTAVVRFPPFLLVPRAQGAHSSAAA